MQSAVCKSMLYTTIMYSRYASRLSKMKISAFEKYDKSLNVCEEDPLALIGRHNPNHFSDLSYFSWRNGFGSRERSLIHWISGTRQMSFPDGLQPVYSLHNMSGRSVASFFVCLSIIYYNIIQSAHIVFFWPKTIFLLRKFWAVFGQNK